MTTNELAMSKLLPLYPIGYETSPPTSLGTLIKTEARRKSCEVPLNGNFLGAVEVWVGDLQRSIARTKAFKQLLNHVTPRHRKMDGRQVGTLVVPPTLKCRCGHNVFWTYLEEPDLWRCARCFPLPGVK